MNMQEKARMLTARRRHTKAHRRMTLFCRSAAEVGVSEMSRTNESCQ
ncbi:hypothetical protein POG22_18180 [Geitlerinema sp. CS-897]|nr:hypothetical protein [Geitlerinema sp. CS-897]